MRINSYDCDGVLLFDDSSIPGLFPRPTDVIITGRSTEEASYTYQQLHAQGIFNSVYFNPVPFREKTRESSAHHKVKMLNFLKQQGADIACHFEDDDIQAAIIEKECKWLNVIRVKHGLVNEENVWRGK